MPLCRRHHASLCRRHSAPGPHGVGVRRERRIGEARVLVEARPFTRPAQTPHGEVRREMATRVVPCGLERPRCRRRGGVGNGEPDRASAGPREPDQGVPARRRATATLRPRDRRDRHSCLRRQFPLAEPGVGAHRPQHRTGELVRVDIHADHPGRLRRGGPVHHHSLCTTSAHWQTLWIEPAGRSGHGSDRGVSFVRPHNRAAPEPTSPDRWEAARRSRRRFRRTFSKGGGGADTTGVSADILRVLVRCVGAASQHAERPRPGNVRAPRRTRPQSAIPGACHRYERTMVATVPSGVNPRQA